MHESPPVEDEILNAAHKNAVAAVANMNSGTPQTFSIETGGECLILGRSEIVFPAAIILSASKNITCLIPDKYPGTTPNGIKIIVAENFRISGALGRFEITVETDVFQSGIIVDLSGKAPLFPEHKSRLGYLRADPKSPRQIANILTEAAQLHGIIEQPFFVTFDPDNCAHSRKSQRGCNACLNVCPTGAIISNGDTVSIDATICSGCGACSAVCPSNAVVYADPSAEHLREKLQTLVGSFAKTSSVAPILLVHDSSYGAEMMALIEGSIGPVVLPVMLKNIDIFSHADMLFALASGFQIVNILHNPRAENPVLAQQVTLAKAMLGAKNPARITILEPADPDELNALLSKTAAISAQNNPLINPLGSNAEITRMAISALNISGTMALPENAPYGAIKINTESCTFCLACTSLCPTQALGENPLKPQILFDENSCIQCGLCANGCPENAITLVPQISENKSKSIYQATPFTCLECGLPFGIKSTIDRILIMLKNSGNDHSASTKLICMCDACKLKAQFS